MIRNINKIKQFLFDNNTCILVDLKNKMVMMIIYS